MIIAQSKLRGTTDDNVVNRDVNKFDKVADEPHQGKANYNSLQNLHVL
jgi:hypothetical protein